MRRPTHELIYEASEYHDVGKSIPVKLFEELCACGETPSPLWSEFNKDADVDIPLFPLNTENTQPMTLIL